MVIEKKKKFFLQRNNLRDEDSWIETDPLTHKKRERESEIERGIYWGEENSVTTLEFKQISEEKGKKKERYTHTHKSLITAKRKREKIKRTLNFFYITY